MEIRVVDRRQRIGKAQCVGTGLSSIFICAV